MDRKKSRQIEPSLTIEDLKKLASTSICRNVDLLNKHTRLTSELTNRELLSICQALLTFDQQAYEHFIGVTFPNCCNTSTRYPVERVEGQAWHAFKKSWKNKRSPPELTVFRPYWEEAMNLQNHGGATWSGGEGREEMIDPNHIFRVGYIPMRPKKKKEIKKKINEGDRDAIGVRYSIVLKTSFSHYQRPVREFIYDEETITRPVLPDEAEELKITYGAKCFIKIETVVVAEYSKDYFETLEATRQSFVTELGEIPVAIKSSLCYLYRRTADELLALGYNVTTPGEYFVLGGTKWRVMKHETKSAYLYHVRVGRDGNPYAQQHSIRPNGGIDKCSVMFGDTATTPPGTRRVNNMHGKSKKNSKAYSAMTLKKNKSSRTPSRQNVKYALPTKDQWTAIAFLRGIVRKPTKKKPSSKKKKSEENEEEKDEENDKDSKHYQITNAPVCVYGLENQSFVESDVEDLGRVQAEEDDGDEIVASESTLDEPRGKKRKRSDEEEEEEEELPDKKTKVDDEINQSKEEREFEIDSEMFEDDTDLKQEYEKKMDTEEREPIVRANKKDKAFQLSNKLSNTLGKYVKKCQNLLIQVHMSTEGVIFPAIIVFRALGITTDAEVMAMIRSGDPEDEWIRYRKLVKQACYLDEGFQTRDQCLHRIGENWATQQREQTVEGIIAQGEFFVRHRLFPTIPYDEKNPATLYRKAVHLAHMCRKVLRLKCKIDEETEQNCFRYRTIVNLDSFLELNAKNAMNEWLKHVTESIKKLGSLFFVLPEHERIRLFKHSSFTQTMYQFHHHREGVRNSVGDNVLQKQTDQNIAAKYSEARRVTNKVSQYSSNKRRRADPSHLFMLCLTETPAGTKSGLTKQETQLNKLTVEMDEPDVEALKQYLIHHEKCILPENMRNIIKNQGWSGWKIALKGPILVFCKDEKDAYDVYMDLWAIARHYLAPKSYQTMGINWDHMNKCIEIHTTAGRNSVPVFWVDEQTQAIRIPKIDHDIWLEQREMLSSSIPYDREHVSFEHSDIYPRYYGIHSTFQYEIAMRMIRNLRLWGTLVWVDCATTCCSQIASCSSDLIPGKTKFKYCLISPVEALGRLASETPWSQQSSATRNIYGSMGKQCMMPTNINDNTGQFMNGKQTFYCQLPLVETNTSRMAIGSLPYSYSVADFLISMTANTSEDGEEHSQQLVDSGIMSYETVNSYKIRTHATKELALRREEHELSIGSRQNLNPFSDYKKTKKKPSIGGTASTNSFTKNQVYSYLVDEHATPMTAEEKSQLTPSEYDLMNLDRHINPKTGLVERGTRISVGDTIIREIILSRDDSSSIGQQNEEIKISALAKFRSTEYKRTFAEEAGIVTKVFVSEPIRSRGEGSGTIQVVSVTISTFEDHMQGDKTGERNGQKHVYASMIDGAYVPWTSSFLLASTTRDTHMLTNRKTLNDPQEMMLSELVLKNPECIMQSTGLPVGVVPPFNEALLANTALFNEEEFKKSELPISVELLDICQKKLDPLGRAYEHRQARIDVANLFKHNPDLLIKLETDWNLCPVPYLKESFIVGCITAACKPWLIRYLNAPIKKKLYQECKQHSATKKTQTFILFMLKELATKYLPEVMKHTEMVNDEAVSRISILMEKLWMNRFLKEDTTQLTSWLHGNWKKVREWLWEFVDAGSGACQANTIGTFLPLLYKNIASRTVSAAKEEKDMEEKKETQNQKEKKTSSTLPLLTDQQLIRFLLLGSSQRVYSAYSGKPMKSPILVGHISTMKNNKLASTQHKSCHKTAKATVDHQGKKSAEANGASKLGVMESAAIVSHGATAFLDAQFFDASDPWYTFICRKCQDMVPSDFSTSRPFCFHCQTMSNEFDYVKTCWLYKFYCELVKGCGCRVRHGVGKALSRQPSC